MGLACLARRMSLKKLVGEVAELSPMIWSVPLLTQLCVMSSPR